MAKTVEAWSAEALKPAFEHAMRDFKWYGEGELAEIQHGNDMAAELFRLHAHRPADARIRIALRESKRLISEADSMGFGEVHMWRYAATAIEAMALSMQHGVRGSVAATA